MAHCCDEMDAAVSHNCSEHPNPYDCPDRTIIHLERQNAYGLIMHDGGSSYVEIAFCPFCGAQLPIKNRK
ncbi:DUF6980 family protein [Cerasicoccus fimbriatus]|uniref:DUF6980 family protein n=1 Tax=Cerasicoccus fimbriatus TaxID=3014554 RepID=UPI003CCCB2D4